MELQTTVDHMAKEAMHVQMESFVVIVDNANKSVHHNCHPKLFANLSHEGLFRSFSPFNLSPGKLPTACEFSVAALGG